jgi:TusA-related sulfurtransferase
MVNTFNLDCSNMVCPIPVAKTKKMLNKMKNGDFLEIYGDFAEAGENIKRYVKGHGGKILEAKTEGENFYLKIEKL